MKKENIISALKNYSEECMNNKNFISYFLWQYCADNIDGFSEIKLQYPNKPEESKILALYHVFNKSHDTLIMESLKEITEGIMVRHYPYSLYGSLIIEEIGNFKGNELIVVVETYMFLIAAKITKSLCSLNSLLLNGECDMYSFGKCKWRLSALFYFSSRIESEYKNIAKNEIFEFINKDLFSISKGYRVRAATAMMMKSCKDVIEIKESVKQIDCSDLDEFTVDFISGISNKEIIQCLIEIASN